MTDCLELSGTGSSAAGSGPVWTGAGGLKWFFAVRRQQNNKIVQNEADKRDERRAGSLSRLIQVVLWTGDELNSESNEREKESDRWTQTGRVRQVEEGKLRGQSLSRLSLFWSSGWSVWIWRVDKARYRLTYAGLVWNGLRSALFVLVEPNAWLFLKIFSLLKGPVTNLWLVQFSLVQPGSAWFNWWWLMMMGFFVHLGAWRFIVDLANSTVHLLPHLQFSQSLSFYPLRKAKMWLKAQEKQVDPVIRIFLKSLFRELDLC